MKIASIAATIVLSATAAVSFNSPKTVKQFKDTSVRIYNLNMNSGGTGSILKSTKSGSHILTNKHVCRLIEPGGYVVREGKRYLVTHYKKFSDHDLCLVRVKANFGINLQVSKTLAQPTDKVFVSGHPNLLPHIVTEGHLSDAMNVTLIVGIKKCEAGDIKKDPMTCVLFGGMPVIKSFEAQVVSSLIKPGSSGSAVFNDKGEITGVVFAGSGRGFSHGFIVPQKYLLYFLAIAPFQKFVKTGTPVDDHGLKGRIFNYSKCLNSKNKICRNSKNDMIWIKND